jgi:large subunit ribosomal protein L7/L12
VKLESFDAGAKPKIIKEVKALVPNLTLIEVRVLFFGLHFFCPLLNLLQAKKFVESLPRVLKEGIPKEDAEKIKKAFEVHGAIVVLD